jgi:hypothetical protein
MSYFYDNQNIQTSLYAGGGATTLTLSNFFVPGGATLAITSLRNHFHANYAANTFLSNTTGFYPPGADNSLLYSPIARIPAFSSALSANQLINSQSRGFYVVVIGAGGGGGGGRNNTAVGVTSPATQTAENPVHPYVDNYTFDFTLTATSAVSMSITFDPLTNTEYGYDFLRLFSSITNRNNSTRTTATGAIYTNSGTSWPSVTLGFGTVYGRFATDTSVTAYGFKLVATFSAASGTANENGNGGASGGSGAIAGYYFDFAANSFNPSGAYYIYTTGTGGTGGGIGTNTTGTPGGTSGSSQFLCFNSSNTQIFSITAGGGTGGAGGKQVSEQPPPTVAGTGGTVTTTGTALSISTGTINVRANGTNGGTNNVNGGGTAVVPIFSLQSSTAAGGLAVVGTTGLSGQGGNGDGTAAPNGSAGLAGNNGGIIVFELF